MPTTLAAIKVHVSAPFMGSLVAPLGICVCLFIPNSLSVATSLPFNRVVPFCNVVEVDYQEVVMDVQSANMCITCSRCNR